MRFWQDLAKTIPAVHEGDLVAVAEFDFGRDCIQPTALLRPTLRGRLLRFGGPCPIPDPLPLPDHTVTAAPRA